MAKWVYREALTDEQLPEMSLARKLLPREYVRSKECLQQLARRRAYLQQPSIVEYQDDAPVYAQAAALIHKSIKSKREFLVWGDYDVDGMTATACMVSCLKELKAKVNWAIPNRTKSGYGIHVPTIRDAIAAPGVIITVDNGISNTAEVKELKDLGYTVIVTDHHLPETEGENASSVADVAINPKLYAQETDDVYMASGCYVSAALAQHLLKTSGKEIRYSIFDYLRALTALSIVSDNIPLNPLMWNMLWQGMVSLRNSQHDGVRALLTMCGTRDNQPISSQFLAFSVIPKLNASGRMDQPDVGCKLLLLEKDTSSRKTDSLLLANQLKYLNADRKIIEQQIFDETKAVAPSLLQVYPHSLVLFDPSWYGGVLGIVAARMLEEFHVPTIILTERDGVLEGSGRSDDSFDLYAALEQNKELLVRFGGHRVAAGVKIDPKQLDTFRQQFDNTARDAPKDTFAFDVDAEVTIWDLFDVNFQYFLFNFEPTGNGNPPLIVQISDVEVKSADEREGACTLVIRDMKTGHVIPVSRYRAPRGYMDLPGRTIDILLTPHPLYFSGSLFMEWKIVDVHVREPETKEEA